MGAAAEKSMTPQWLATARAATSLFDTKRTKEGKDTKSEHKPAQALFEQDNIEVHQEAHAQAR
jgi:hypothetical protein